MTDLSALAAAIQTQVSNAAVVSEQLQALNALAAAMAQLQQQVNVIQAEVTNLSASQQAQVDALTGAITAINTGIAKVAGIALPA